MSCDHCGIEANITNLEELESSDSDSDASFRNDRWEDKVVVIQPGDAWEKPQENSVLLKQVSISPPHGSTGMCGILTAMLTDMNVSIAKLTNDHPNQQLNVQFGELQDVFLLNEGNRSITLSIMIKV